MGRDEPRDFWCWLGNTAKDLSLVLHAFLDPGLDLLQPVASPHGVLRYLYAHMFCVMGKDSLNIP